MSTQPWSPRIEKRNQIQALSKEGHTVLEISQELGVTPKTVMLWKHRPSVTDKKRSGRPRAVSPTTAKL